MTDLGGIRFVPSKHDEGSSSYQYGDGWEKVKKSHHAVLLPALLLQHDDAVRALVEGGGQALPLRVQRLDPPFQVELALSHYCDLIPESLEMGDVLSHACLLVVHLVPHRLQLTRERFLNFRTLQNHCIYLDTKSTTHILELTGEPLVLLCELGDQQ